MVLSRVRVIFSISHPLNPTIQSQQVSTEFQMARIKKERETKAA
jgi:hypothetical protein